MKKWLKNIVWMVFFALVLFIMSFAGNKHENTVVGLPKVNIEMNEDMMFLTESDILQRLQDKQLIDSAKTYSHLELEKIEQVLSDMPEIKEAQVYSFVGGTWNIDVKLRQPIARIFNQDSTSCYLDKDGTLMPLSDNYTAHVITVDGFINETDYKKSVTNIMNNDSLITIEILDDLYEISNYVCSDEFFSAQITHIYINEYAEFEMIPRVGNQRILFGNAEHIPGKFKKLEYFYLEGISRAGWDSYDTINIMYENQVVCSKRN